MYMAEKTVHEFRFKSKYGSNENYKKSLFRFVICINFKNVSCFDLSNVIFSSGRSALFHNFICTSST